MGRGGENMKPKKPNYSPEAEQNKIIEEVCTFFGRVYDDFEEERHKMLRGIKKEDARWEEIMMGDPTINETAEEFGITTKKVRKLLIMGGCYSTTTTQAIQEKIKEGKTVEQIAEEIGKKPITVRSYLPYEKVIYNLEERSVNADRLVRFKERWGGYKARPVDEKEDALKELQEKKDSLSLWRCICLWAGEEFHTSGRGITFSYSISAPGGAGGRHYGGEQVNGFGNEMWITTAEGEKKKSISRSTVDRAFQTVISLGCYVPGPKALNVPGAHSYLYSVFLRFGLIKRDGKE